MSPIFGPRRWSGIVAATVLFPTLALAADVRVVAITPGRSAQVVIDGRDPIAIDVGQTIDGVKVLGVDSQGAVVSVAGKTRTVSLEPLESGSGVASAGDSGSVTLTADPSGHFSTSGAVNGKPVHFLVDTGATLVAVSRSQADRLRIDYRRGTPTVSMTANGAVRGWLVTFASVRVGNVTVRGVEGIVVDGQMSSTLLGMSFLNSFDMNRRGRQLVLRRSAR